VSRLRCVAPYRNDARGLQYVYGQIIEGDAALLAYLVADAPACFDVAPEGKQATVEDKTIKRAPASKGI
jgi:hypothetical protein